MTSFTKKPLLLCYASLFALSLCSCSQNPGKSGSELSVNDSDASASTAGAKKTRTFRISKNGLRRLQAAKKAGVGGKKYDNLWDRLFALYDLPLIEHESIEREMEWFVNHQDYLDRVQTRAEPFLYNIVLHLEKKGVPGELALLPVIESAFQPQVISPANAAGIWQFIPETGRRYGLKKNPHYDGRRDVYASTRAAIKYLRKLHDQFDGDWLLAVAAYNCGEGAVSRAIERNTARGLPTDFWALDLPQETRAYVPRLLAVSRIFADADEYGVALHPLPNRALYRTVKVHSQLDLALAADAADISLNKLFELNPGFSHQKADVEGGYRLFVPADKYRTFKDELGRMAEQSASINRARADDWFGSDVEEAEFIDEENDAKAGLKRSQRVKSKESAHGGERAEKGRGIGELARRGDEPKGRVREELAVDGSGRLSIKSGKRSTYAVEPGDSLTSIARKTGVDVEQLKKWNGLNGKTPIKSGQNLVVWDKDSANKLPLTGAGAGIKPSQSLRYTVKQGDSLFAISRKFNVTLADLRKWNGRNLDKQFKPGMNLTISREKD
ncbi:MAG: LysM peptidoglycan-binding domain-containing protein [Methylococcaceae bacterium]|nr:LysM peptidoglycan-binding domain-containing protein [Methylococcaceae bacterium]